MIKKTLIIFLIAASILVSTSTVFGANETIVFSDISDSKVKTAAERLAKLGIVEGNIKGQYLPGDKITRAEFAKMAVIASGLGDAAKISGGETKFHDVPANHWASGYINIAMGQSFISGYPDGTFAPEKEITYAEGITILLRVLGYSDELLPGPWPSKYIAKSAEKGITEGLPLSPSPILSRGDFALLMSNTLDKHVLKAEIQPDGKTVKLVEDPDKTLLKKAFNQ